MGKAIPVRDSSFKAVKGAYKNISTEGETSRYSAQDSGARYIETSVLGTPTITLPWNYQVGNKQLNVFIVDSSTGRCDKLVDLETLSSYYTPPYPDYYYEELSSDKVKVHTPALVPVDILFEIPHTATPGTFNSKVVVRDQGDNVGIDLEGSFNGIRLRDSEGNKHIIRVTSESSIFVVAD